MIEQVDARARSHGDIDDARHELTKKAMDKLVLRTLVTFFEYTDRAVSASEVARLA